MPIYVSEENRSFSPAPEGLWNAVCVDVIDMGLQDTPWGPKAKVSIRWQIEELNPDTGKRFVVSNRYGLSLHERATLRRHLESWRGKPLGQDDLKKFDLERLIGVPCQLQVVHHLASSGQTYANVQSIVPPGKGMPRMTPEGYVRQQDRKQTEPDDTSDDQVPF